MQRTTLCLALALAACATGERAAPLASSRDSAGIRIVENAAPAVGTAEFVTLSADPVLVLGRLDGPREEQFGRTVHARLIGDGVAVLDAENDHIVLFALDGKLRRTIGQDGEGPGDMRRASEIIAVNGDSLVLWDYLLRRVTTFDTAGTVLGLVTLPRGTMQEQKGMRFTIGVNPRYRLPDGRFVATSIGRMRVNPPTGVYHDSLVYWLVDDAGATDSLAKLAGALSWNFEFPGRSVWFDSVAFAPRATDAFTHRSWFRVEGDRFEVIERDWTATVRRLIRSGRARRPVSGQDRARIREREVGKESAENRADVNEIYDWMPYPDSMPAYDQLAVDATGLIWARVFPDTATTATWDLFDSDGNLLRTAHLPSDLVIRDIGADYLLAQRQGELDEPLVVLYGITRGN